MNTPPTGTVTFLFTDIEGSTRLWEERPDEMRAALAEHDALLRAAIDAHGGYVFSTGGDGFAAAFSRAHEAVDAALNAQAALADHPLIRVRMGIYTGEVQERDGDYFGPAVNRAARIMAAGHGGQVLLSQTTADLDGRADLRALGEHRLRDLASPVSLWQVGHQTHPALRTLEGLRHNLPIQPTSLVGREDDAKSVQSLLRSSRLVTLTGVGGVGKTRLALQVAADVASEYPDGVFLVELATVRSVQEVGGVIATAMGIEVRAGDPLDQIREVVGSRKMLLVLDNCEHLLDGVAAAAATLLSRCAGLHFVATSREPLGVAGETTERVRSLPVGDSGVGHAEQLFMQRALAALPEFAPDDSARKLISGICQRLDGIPLAIELAAARVRTLSVADISARLDQRFRLLTGGSRTALERHQTLRAAVEWSYSLLTADQQVVLDRISVFAGGFDLDAAEAVIGVDPIDAIDVLDHLAALTERSLLNADTTGGPTRYRLLETIRQFAREKLVARDEADTFADRHATYYMERMTTRRIRRFEAGVADFVAFETDVDNLRAAFDYFVDAGRDRDAVQAGIVLADHWGFSGIGQEPERVNRLFASVHRLDDAAKAHALSVIAYPFFWGGDAAAAADAARRALALETHAERLDPLLYVVLAYTALGVEDALHWFDHGIANARQLQDNFALVESLAGAAGYLGIVQRGNRATRYSDELQPLMAVAGDISRMIGANGIVSGRIFTDPRSVFELLDEDLCESLGRLAGWTQHWFGCASVMLGEHRRALDYFRQAASMASDRGFWSQALMTLRWGGATLIEFGEAEAAAELSAAADVSSHWEFDALLIEDAVVQARQASESLPTEVLAAAKSRGSKLSLSEALARFIETCDRVLARVPAGSPLADEQ